MSLVRVKALGWTLGEKLTAAQMTSVDANIENALDKRSGQTDTLSSTVSCAGAGRIIRTYIAGANADTTYQVNAANSIIDVTTLSAIRTYTLSNTGAVAGDIITVLNRNTSWYVVVQAATGPTTLAILGVEHFVPDFDVEATWAEFLFTGTTWVLFKSSIRPKLNVGASYATFNANGNWTCPRGCYTALLVGFGGGGGGAGGGSGMTSVVNTSLGGGGGGGAQARSKLVSVTPSGVYAVTIGAGGIAGTGGVFGGAAPSRGGDGLSTTFGSLATFKGGRGGTEGLAAGTVGTASMVAKGGFGVGYASGIGAYTERYTISAFNDYLLTQSIPGSGGVGSTGDITATVTTPGVHSVEGFAGGSGGARPTGAVDLGGGGGGGGGGGPNGAGANGASGGADAVGGTGSSAAANTGAGGGGGGGAGGPRNGGAGGAGGSGQLIVIPIYG